jgi:protein-S-isoprenylcysteine O-methyltransferase Ste14
MDAAEWERAGALYGPILVALVVWAVKTKAARTSQRLSAVGCLLGLLWAGPSLVALQALNLRFGWWTYAPGSPALLRGMPLELLLGWMVLWGVVPALVVEWLGVWGTAALMVAVDCVMMPCCAAVVRLGSGWLVGEAAGVCLVLMPAVCLAGWTGRRTHLRARAALQVGAAAGLFLYLVPEISFAVRPGIGWGRLLGMRAWERELWLALVLALAVPGLAAVMEFAGRGGGTPIPYDAPLRLVRSGMYRYVANPMQLSCLLVTLAWAGAIGSGWMVLAAAMSVAYSAGIAAWDEGEDLRMRFGADWLRYREEVRDWRPRVIPCAVGEDAVVYVARGCEPCSEVRRWLEARSPVGLRILHAEVLPQGSIQRMRYVAADGARQDGVRAFARCLEHLHVGWAWVGAVMRLPGVWWGLQVGLDASGLGPRELCAGPLKAGPVGRGIGTEG